MAGRKVWHLEDNVCKLSCLTHTPIEKLKYFGLVDRGGVNDEVLNSNIKVDCAIMVRIFSVNHRVAIKTTTSFDGGWIEGISHQYCTNVKLQR